MQKFVKSPYIKFVPGLIVFTGFLFTHDLQVLTFAAAFILWPTLRSVREM